MKTFGDPTFALSATSSSGLPISYSSSNPDIATVSGGTVAIVGAGSATITASQIGNSSYYGAPVIEQILVVEKANQTITFNSLLAKTYGDAPFTLTAASTSGLPISYTSSNTSVATISGNTVTIVGAGTTTITASQAGNSNFNAAPSVNQTLLVNKLNQSISFGPLPTKTYGNSPFSISATSSSGLPVTFISSNSSIASISGNTIFINGAGTVTITAQQSGNANFYAASPVNQTLVINKADQTITFNPIPSLCPNSSTSLAGLAYSNVGLPITSFSSLITTVATVSGNTLTGKAAGSGSIIAYQAGNANYNSATGVRSVTVNPIPSVYIYQSSGNMCNFGYVFITASVSPSGGNFYWLPSSPFPSSTSNVVPIWGGNSRTVSYVKNGCSKTVSYYATPCSSGGGGSGSGGGGGGGGGGQIPRIAADVDVEQEITIDMDGVSVHPNPANQELTVHLPTVAEFDTPIKMIDQLGKVIRDSQILQGRDRVSVSTGDIGEGIYFIQIEGGRDNMVRKKVMIVHK